MDNDFIMDEEEIDRSLKKIETYLKRLKKLHAEYNRLNKKVFSDPYYPLDDAKTEMDGIKNELDKLIQEYKREFTQ